MNFHRVDNTRNEFRFKLRKSINSYALISVFAFGLILSLTIQPLYVKKELVDAVGEPQYGASTLSFTSSNDTASVMITPTESGNFATSSGSSDIRFSLSTDNHTGYTLSAKSSKTTLDNGSSSLLPLASAVTAEQFATASNTTLNNRWGYKPSYLNSAANSNYLSSSTTATVLDTTTTANTTSKNYTISLGARVDTSIPSGTYVNNTLTLEYVANAVPYTISFNKNSEDDIVSSIPSSVTGESVSATTIPLPNTVPSRVNYTFGGWCTVRPTEVAGGQSCSGITYAAGATYVINNAGSNTGAVLYAIWTSNRNCNKAATTIGTGVTATDAVCMQDINDTVITSMVQGTQHTLIDMRDGKSYFIAKQADGKVWMTQNLDYDLSTSTTLTHDNTDLGYTTTNLNKTWTPARATLTGDVSSWHNDASVVDSYDPGTKYYYSSGTLDDDTESTTCDNSSTCAHYHAGNYYNWPAAVAGNIPASTDQYTKAEDSVCPAGWKLVKGPANSYTYGEDAVLFAKNAGADVYYYISDIKASYVQDLSYNLDSFRNAPVYWVRAGYIKNSAFIGIGKYASYWTEIINDVDTSFDAWVSGTYFYLRDSTAKTAGFPVRCVARMTTGTTTVNFNGNGATSGSMAARTAPSGDAINITNEFEKEGHKFIKWNTAADGSGIDYTGAQSGSTNGVVAEPTQSLSLTLYAQWEEAFVIKYDGNGATGTTTMAVTHEVADNEEITLYASNYSRAGYGFLGWSTTQINPDAENASTLIANATIFGPNETITANATNLDRPFPATVTLYAVWIKSTGDMQDWQGCSSMSTGDVTARKDTRDNQVYAIAKLADGNCWMIENLRLDAANSTDVTKAQGFGGVFAGLADSELASFASSTTANTKYSANTSSSGNIILGENVQYRFPRYNNANTISTVATMTKSNQNIYSYGNYYSFNAAKASTSEMKVVADSENSGTSICPLGWRLPTGGAIGNNKEQDVLNIQVNSGSSTVSTGLRTYPNNYIYSGYVYNSSINGRGTTGDYYSATGSGVNGGYAYEITLSTAKPSSKYRSLGAAIRCIAASGITITLHSNDDKDKVGHIYVASGSSKTLPMDVFTNEGYRITSWNTAANGSGTSYAGTYTFSSNITLYAQWESAYTIKYNGNGATSTSTMDAFDHYDILSGETITPYQNNIGRTGYGFLGWSFTQIDPDDPDYASIIRSTKIYGPSEDITVNSSVIGQNAPATAYLYAVWVKSEGNFQGWDSCGRLTASTYSNGTITAGSVTALTDTRDGQTYAIAKLPDGQCWMIENLRTNPKTANITDSNTNHPTSSFLANRSTTNSWCNTYSAECTEKVLFQNHSTSQYAGTYYNWYTATAGNGLYESNDGSGGDICPVGWHMPSGGTTTASNYANLSYSLGGNRSTMTSSTTPTGAVIQARLKAFPINFVVGGNTYRAGTFDYYTTWSYNWANKGFVSSSKYYGYYLGIDSTNVRVGSGNAKYVAMYMRCIKNGSNISYNGNGASNPNTMSGISHKNIVIGNNVTLYASNYQRAGYGFLGWSRTQIDPDSATFAADLANSTVYGPNETISTTGFNDTTTLYAVWIKSAGNLQDWAGCSSMSTNDVTALKDTRDNQVYAVAKLADGNCWMIENLRLDAANSTDVSKSQGFGGVFTGLATAETTNFSNSTITNSLYSTTNITGDNQGNRIPRYNNANTNNTVANMTSSNQNIYSYGNYYNWPAAMANTNDITSITSSVNAGTSICPTGWRLPTGDSGGEYANLNTVVNSGSSTSSTGFRSYPNNFVFSGAAYYSSVVNRGLHSYYSALGADSEHNSDLYMSSTEVSAIGATYKYLGLTVRCLLANQIQITLDSNDGTNRVARVYGQAGSSLALPSDTFIYDGYKITSWNTSPDGTGDNYNTGSAYTISSSTTLYAQWAEAYNISYNGNNATAGSMVNSHNVVPGEKIILYALNFKKDGYGFAGWSLNSDGSGNIYGPNETVTIDNTFINMADANNNIILYAIWIASSGNLQNWSNCSSLVATTYDNTTGTLTPGTIVALTDTRDNNTYTVAKLSDGRCWMIEDLRLNPSTAAMTADNTNNPTTDFLNSRTTAQEWCEDQSDDCGERVLYADYSTAAYAGTYYNWYTATAGRSRSSTSTASGDICPAGWHLPTPNENSSYRDEYYLLGSSAGFTTLQNYTSTTNPTAATVSAWFRAFPNNFQLAGNRGVIFYNYRTDGRYFSAYAFEYYNGATVPSDYFGGILYIGDEESHTREYGYSKTGGARIRCIHDSIISYNGNGASNPDAMSGISHKNIAMGSNITLYASNDYNFPF